MGIHAFSYDKYTHRKQRYSTVILMVQTQQVEGKAIRQCELSYRWLGDDHLRTPYALVA